jgi:membrane-bound ClpP family serine protease
MLDWITVILLIGLGLVLIIIELIFVPGTTIVGIIGFVLAVVGIWFGYAALGTTIGHIVLGSSILVAGVAFYYSFKNDLWSRFALNNQNNSHVNEEYPHALELGENGITVSALRPQGTVIFNERRHEVQTNGEFIAPNTMVRIIKLKHNKITVEAVS